jgi:hypothetical protein
MWVGYRIWHPCVRGFSKPDIRPCDQDGVRRPQQIGRTRGGPCRQPDLQSGRTTTNIFDAARVELLLYELRLASIGGCGPRSPSHSTRKDGSSRVHAVLAEHQMADRGRGFERHPTEARLLAGKTLARFDFEIVATVLGAQVMALASGDAWSEEGANILLFGRPGGGKSRLSPARSRPEWMARARRPHY